MQLYIHENWFNCVGKLIIKETKIERKCQQQYHESNNEIRILSHNKRSLVVLLSIPIQSFLFYRIIVFFYQKHQKWRSKFDRSLVRTSSGKCPERVFRRQVKGSFKRCQIDDVKYLFILECSDTQNRFLAPSLTSENENVFSNWQWRWCPSDCLP